MTERQKQESIVKSKVAKTERELEEIVKTGS